jgi:hypothetical protein
MKKARWWLIFFIVLLILAGCGYPQEKRQQLDQLPEHVLRVQTAVDLYKKQKNELPYRYRDDEIMLTSKYIVDFDKLQGHLSSTPPTAYEQGGTYLYVLIDVEKDPTVRLLDLRINEAVQAVQQQVQFYYRENKKWPTKEKVGPYYWKIDFEKLRSDPVTIQSPYSSQAKLELLLDQQGRVFLDYRNEAMRMIQQAKEKPASQGDLRIWLAKQSHFVPAYSPPMTYEKNEPILQQMK